MADRNVYGNDFSENGWRMVDQGSCVWVTVPGTDVHLQIREGQPAAVMGAFAADFNAYVEPLRDRDSACWTPTNSVGSSNHLSGTAMDLNWDSHQFRVADAGFNAAQIGTCRELLAFYEDMIFWGNDWDNPKDAMHWQMGYDTYGSGNVEKVNDFIRRKIRADGFSTFRRDATAPPPQQLSRTDRYALAIIAEGRKRNISPKGIQIALSVPFVESGYKIYANSNVPESLSYPHDAVGSDHDSNGLFQQRMAWGPLSCTMDPACSAGLFYDGGKGGQRGLTDFDYNSDARTPGGWAQAVQVSAFPDRYDQHFSDAVALYNRLANTSTDSGDDMAQVPQDQWDRVYRELTQRLPSRSPLRHVGEGVVDTMAGFLLNVDGSQHVEIVTRLARYGDPDALALLREVAGNSDPNRQHDAQLAQAILADVTSSPSVATVVNNAAPAPPQVVYVDRPVAASAPATLEQTSNGQESTGQIIGAAYDALQKLRLADALPIEDRAPLAALISVLSTKNGSQL